MKRFIFSAASALMLALTAHALAQTPITGTWSIEPARTPGQMHFDTQTDANGSSHNESSHDVAIRSLGLSDVQLHSPGNHVTFTLAHEAGSFVCQGWLANAKGGGTFVFTASSSYLSKMRDRGYADIPPNDQMAAAQLDLTVAYVDSLASAGYPHLPFETLIPFRALNVNDAYIRSMRAAFGGAAIDSDQLIPMRALGVTPAFLQQMHAAGLAVTTPAEAVQMRALGIDVAYLKRVQAHGFPNPSVEQLVRLKATNVI
jgi:hypothetical protein